MLHRVSDERDDYWPPLPVADFRSLVKELADKTHLFALEKIQEVTAYGDRPMVALSFDDGYLDFYENTLPILSEFRVPAHHNICPSLIDRQELPWTQMLNMYLQSNDVKALTLPHNVTINRVEEKPEAYFLKICNELYKVSNKERSEFISSLRSKIPGNKMRKLMSWAQIRECHRAGIHIGSHGMNHYNLPMISDIAELEIEVEGSRKRIAEEVGESPRIFAFPNGQWNRNSLRMVEKTGYEFALLCDDMVSEFDNCPDFMVLPRIGINQFSWKEETLRAYGFHQKVKFLVKRTPYLLQKISLD